MSIEALVEVSRYYGRNGDFVLAGGGNTSFKDKKTLYVKGSGQSLADVDSGSFVKMDRKVLSEIWEQKYPRSNAERESAVLAGMMAARKPGEEEKRPSVEALLHDIMPFNFIVHLHPALVNGLACSQQGKKAMTEIFGDEAIWIPSTNPGYVLSKNVKAAMNKYAEKFHKAPEIIFLQNHGVFVGADSTDIIKERYDKIMEKIKKKITRNPDFSDEKILKQNKITSSLAAEIAGELAELGEGTSAFMVNREILRLVKNSNSFYPLSSAFTPDHIVYAGSDPLFVKANVCNKTLNKAWKDHVNKTGRNPKIIAVQNLGIFSAGASEKSVSLALVLFKDAIKVAVYSESFGGPLFMTPEKIDFINNWEVERFRAGVLIK